ncbi:Betaine aldehyde dehydrogenase [Capillimicrobium parvum]|uniref:Betaine aldehyde dehydrogenase n=2 Tax=Capillimicrobium parvum TaxID=2884022 RepID=A0A9E6XY81_9ACTN|nr:Betaine aldehyde dehydrogenase [Capillimicrobium parvum]
MMIGAEHETRSGETLDVLTPSTGEVIARVPAGDATDVDLAVARAKEAFATWSRVPAAQRAKLINRLADLVDERLPELFELETSNNGRPIVETRAQLSMAGGIYRYNAALALTERGETFDAGPQHHGYLQRSPLGVCGVIVPFNHPFLIMARGVAPALAAGNTVVVKPSELTPLTALRFARLAAEAGIPDGVVNVVTGLGPAVGAPLTRHPDVKKIEFTGGAGTGRQVAVAAAERFVSYSAELGGKTPVLVFDDAGVEEAARGCAFAAFIAAGQTCVCGSRILVQESMYDAFVSALVEQTGAIGIGDPADRATQMGPLISAAARDRSAAYTAIARDEGATILTGGAPPRLDAPFDRGFFFAPTIVGNATNGMRCAQEEIFGPVIVVATFRDEADAIRQANDIPFGLGAAIWTRDVARAHRVAGRIEAGMVWVNDHHRTAPAMPWGGVKDPGFGKQSGREAYDSFTTVKAVVVRTAPDPVDWYGSDPHDRLN